jgi:hypothetical protein
VAGSQFIINQEFIFCVTIKSSYEAHLVCSIVIFEIRLRISEILLVSLAWELNPCRVMKEIVARIARIVITTINSTRVKACLACIDVEIKK